MNKHTLENLLIFSAICCNTYNGNKGEVYPSYISEKSRKFIGVDITDIDDITINDFINITDTVNFYSKPLLPDIILNNIKDKISINELDSSVNINSNDIDIWGNKLYVVNGLDSQNTIIFESIYKELTDEYFIKTIREYKSYILLKDD